VSSLDPTALAQELMSAYSSGRGVSTTPSSRDAAFDLPTAYAVEAELARIRRSTGRTIVGRKVGFANRALWRILKLDTVVWAHMYDDTVQYAPANEASLSLARMRSPKIEPEIVFKLKSPPGAVAANPAALLDAVEWLALGFEIIDCPFPDWQFQPVDFVASFGFHAALVVGEPRDVDPASPGIIDQLPKVKVKLLKNGELVDEGSGKNVLRSPLLCLGELAASIARQPGTEPLTSGEIISTGTITTSQPIATGETWTATVDRLDLPDLTLHLIP
jgi:2-oxo-3-hexenedioate decarboxylase